MSNGSTPRPPAAPPKPPPRRAEPAAEQVQNPFMVSAPTPEPSEANPFLAGSPAPAPVSQVGSSPRVVPPSQGAPLRVRPGVEAPHVRDAHAEFRKGGWMKPLLFIVLAAGVIGGLFYGIPAEETKKPSPFAETKDAPMAVIGASVSPEVIPDPTRPSLQNQNPEPKQYRQEEAAPPPAEHADRSDTFGSAFKSSAK